MNLDLNTDEPMPLDGGNRPVPYESNGAAWSAAFNLLLALREFRGVYPRPVDAARGDHLVREFARRVRASGPEIRLNRIQRYVASDERLVVCIYALAAQFGLERDRGLSAVCTLAVGFDPARLRRMAELLISCRWVVCYDYQRGGLYAVEWFLDFATGKPSIGEDEARWLKGKIQLLPTSYGGRKPKGRGGNVDA